MSFCELVLLPVQSAVSKLVRRIDKRMGCESYNLQIIHESVHLSTQVCELSSLDVSAQLKVQTSVVAFS